ncbi:hypothetical protein LR48_Vigan347s000400 [Vigna angularis]|uniref:Uncharacterized protein n=1 Tax=Phaseolus angularis TaxID=3914 RepID=A0A0L9T8N2_PHAAN|nr:hypothetical protein LR48_Vigan347s000400 [Vigna angularis]
MLAWILAGFENEVRRLGGYHGGAMVNMMDGGEAEAVLWRWKGSRRGGGTTVTAAVDGCVNGAREWENGEDEDGRDAKPWWCYWRRLVAARW